MIAGGIVFGPVTPGILPNGMPEDKALIAEANAQQFYNSEHGQGMTTAIAGGIILVLGIVMNKTWLIGIGIVVGLAGMARMSRAADFMHKADVTYAQSLGAKL